MSSTNTTTTTTTSATQEIRLRPAYADLKTVPYAGLARAEPEALDTLWRAVTGQGFFYLKLDNPVAEDLSSGINTLFQTSHDLFHLPTQDKMQYDTKIMAKERNYGYKPMGRNVGIGGSEKDGHELYLIPRDILFESSPDLPAFAGPPPLYQHQDTLKCVTLEAQEICNTILSALSTLLAHEQASPVDFSTSHRFEEASTTAIGLLKYPLLAPGAPEAGHIAHTDVGSLTLLFATQAGLQVEDPEAGPGGPHWLDVELRPGMAVVNIGDALRFLSDRTFRSCLHRVLPHTTGSEDRYSIAYFLRPGVNTLFRDSEGCMRTSLEWMNRKFEGFQSRDANKLEGILNAAG